MSTLVIRFLLAVLNSRWLNHTPCRYEFVGNVTAFSRAHLDSCARQKPTITVAEILKVADDFAACPISPGLTVIEDGVPREGTVWDVHELRCALNKERGNG